MKDTLGQRNIRQSKTENERHWDKETLDSQRQRMKDTGKKKKTENERHWEKETLDSQRQRMKDTGKKKH